jgi:hypothetical protein
MARAPAFFLLARKNIPVEKLFNGLQHGSGFYRIKAMIKLMYPVLVNHFPYGAFRFFEPGRVTAACCACAGDSS